MRVACKWHVADTLRHACKTIAALVLVVVINHGARIHDNISTGIHSEASLQAETLDIYSKAIDLQLFILITVRLIEYNILDYTILY